jgi:hypothetical protein
MDEMNESENSLRLRTIAHARSGDKGNHANVGVIARSDAAFEYLKKTLTESFVREFFAELSISKVERFELPGIRALNFLLHDALEGGASRSLRTDSQGKVLAIALLEAKLPLDESLDSVLESHVGN